MGWLVYPHFGTAGITLQLGDDMNGFIAERECKTTGEAAEFIGQCGARAFPSLPTRLKKMNGSGAIKCGRIGIGTTEVMMTVENVSRVQRTVTVLSPSVTLTP